MPFLPRVAKTIRTEIPKKFPKDVAGRIPGFSYILIHKWALPAAEVAHCVGNGNDEALWGFDVWLFEHQEEVTASNLKEKALAFAKTQRYEQSKIGACIDSHGGAEQVKQGLQAGQELVQANAHIVHQRSDGQWCFESFRS